MGAECIACTHCLNIVGAAAPTAPMDPTPMHHHICVKIYFRAEDNSLSQQFVITKIMFVIANVSNFVFTKSKFCKLQFTTKYFTFPFVVHNVLIQTNV